MRSRLRNNREMNPDDPDARNDPDGTEIASFEALERLSARLAHDFNNVLQVIGGNLQLLGGTVAGNAAAERRLGAAIEGVAHGAALTAGLQSQPFNPKKTYRKPQKDFIVSTDACPGGAVC